MQTKKRILFCLTILLVTSGLAQAQQGEQELASAAAQVEQALGEGGIGAARARFAELTAQREQYSFDANEFIALGRRLVEAGWPAEAIAILELAAGQFPDSWSLQLALAQACFAAGEEEASMEHLQRMRDIRNQAVLEQFMAQNRDILATTADEVIQRHIDATGGEEAWRAIDTMVVKFAAHGGGSRFRIVRMYKRPLFYRQGMEGGEYFAATDGRRVWQVSPEGWAEVQGNAYRRLGLMDGGFIDYRELGISYEFVGLHVIDGAPVYQLKRTYSDGFEQELFFSVESGLLIEVLSEYIQGSPTMRSYMSYWDYRDVGGVKIPHVFIRNVGALGPPHGGVIEEVQINVPLDDALFTPPQQ